MSSIVITLDGDTPRRAVALERLAVFPGLELGQLEGAWLTAVFETVDASSSIAAIERIPGVLFVEVVFVEIPSA